MTKCSTPFLLPTFCLPGLYSATRKVEKESRFALSDYFFLYNHPATEVGDWPVTYSLARVYWKQYRLKENGVPRSLPASEAQGSRPAGG